MTECGTKLGVGGQLTGIEEKTDPRSLILDNIMNKDSTTEMLSSRFGIIISVLGIAVGTGNIWRFSRIVSQNDGDTFLIPWTIF